MVVALIEDVGRDIVNLVAMLTNHSDYIARRQLLHLDVKLKAEDYWFIGHIFITLTSGYGVQACGND